MRNNEHKKKKKGSAFRSLFVLALVVIGMIQGLSWFRSFSTSTNQTSPAPQDSEPVVISELTTEWGISKKDNVELASDMSAKNFYIILDGSGSMGESECSDNETKAAVAVRSLVSFADSVAPDANLGLLIFDNKGTSERVPLGLGNRDAFKQAVQNFIPDGQTPLYDAMLIGALKLQEQAEKQQGYGEYTLVVVTDGIASMRQEPDNVIKHLLKHSPIVVQTIGFCIGEKHSLNQVGKTVYKAAGNEAELNSGLESVLAESETFDISDFEK
jgi:Ca-activated chloride channel family protein